ncbi:Alkaline nuclease [Frankliniella fusca]|uniref:Alkaline nuclease n=1 Tax=Frankliniella fusca TaxID=407009 RepID=A0AAE1I2I7_9NEOP|nr:Alkaline nuclease [Frankliniella fusca]
MCGDGGAGFMWLMSPEPVAGETSTTVLSVAAVSDNIKSSAFQEAKDKARYLQDRVKVTLQVIKDVAAATVDQTKCPLWQHLRIGIITASNFGDVIKVINSKRKPCASLMKKWTESRGLKKIHSIAWGIGNEATARLEFEEKMNVKVNQLLPLASPVGSDFIIEIKCPYSLRKTKYLKKSLSRIPDRKSEEYIVHWSEKHQEYIISEAHDYYNQIQGQLHITQRELCYLVIWAPSDKENPL